MIDVEHNADHLPFAKRVPVWNVRTANELIHRLMATKRPRGMRLRHDPDPVGQRLWLSARSAEPLRLGIRVLSDAGMLRSRHF